MKFNQKKLVAILVLATLFISFTSVAFAKGPKNPNAYLKGNAPWKKVFRDVGDGYEWARLAIDKMSAKDILKGYPGNLYKPSKNVTCLEAIVISLRVMEWEDEKSDVPDYVKRLDLPWNDAYYYVAVALKKGLITPKELKNFNPNAPAKRYEVARYIVRALDLEDEAQEHMDKELSFKDANAIPKDAIGYVYIIIEEGLMEGYPGNKFMPNKPITRAEMAVLADKLDDNVNKENKNELIGTVRKIEIDENTITIKNNYGRKTYKMAEDVPVYEKGKYITIEDIRVGDEVELVLNNKDKVVFILLTERTAEEEDDDDKVYETFGFVTEIKANKDQIYIFPEKIEEGFVGVVREVKIEGLHYELQTGYGKLVLSGEIDDIDKYVGDKIFVTGELVDRASIYMRGYIIEVEDFYPIKDRDIERFEVDNDTKIYIDGKSGELFDIEMGDFVEIITDDDENVLEINTNSLKNRFEDWFSEDKDDNEEKERDNDKIKDGNIKGKFISFKIGSTRKISIESEDGNFTFTLDENVRVKGKGARSLRDIDRGMKVKLKIKNNKVVEIKIEEK